MCENHYFNWAHYGTLEYNIDKGAPAIWKFRFETDYVKC